MIIADIKCGMGNQMFQYAYARAVQEKNKDKKIKFNLVTAKRMKDGRNYALKHCNLKNGVKVQPLVVQYISDIFFKLRIKKFVSEMHGISTEGQMQLLAKKGIYYTESVYDYLEIPKTKKRIKYVNGWWQSYKYFEKIGESIKYELRIKTPPSEKNKEMLKEILSLQAVCVHIRRGDYLSEKFADELNICNEHYYREAMRIVAEKVKQPVFYVFSTSHKDIEWIKCNWSFSYPVRYIDLGNPDYEEIRLMYSCKHFILANSTFSWWAAYLAENKDKIVVVPDTWNQKYQDFENIYKKEWIKIPLK